MKKTNAKNVAIGTGVAAIWIGGFAACWFIGDITGKTIAKVCTKATERLLAL